MKVKLLLIPLFVVIIIALMIWVVVPAYFDLKTEQANLKNAQAKLADVQAKSAQSASLVQSLESKTDQRATLLKYLPDKEQEEDVISSLNSMAGQAGLAILSLSVSVQENNANLAPVEPVSATNYLPAPNQAVTDGPPTQNISVTNVPTVVNVDFKVVGSYEKIKSLIERFPALKRFSEISKITIKKSTAAAAEGQQAVNSQDLEADMVLSLNYLKKIDSVANIDGKIFSSGDFDMSVIKQIGDKTYVDVSKVSSDAGARGNPFLP